MTGKWIQICPYIAHFFYNTLMSIVKYLRLRSQAPPNIYLRRVFVSVSQFYLANVKSIPFTGDYGKYWNSFICAGLYNMTIDWIKDGKTASKALLAEIIRKIGG
ncbi:hypothetical protein [Lacticaseibacillus hegangensis]|uniref:hypothetical protein n=1 Tax=Lacticaseibacillus hegangensis TaxID=2486010 RepID=UPI0013DE5D0B|nr:hypothetical protein [Lacticaseibacillus hegangensis]